MNDNYNEYMVIDGELEHVGNTVADMTGYLNENDIATDAEVDAAIEDVGEIYPRAFHVNRNLLRNWYFKKPVNQLGKTEIDSTSSVNEPFLDSWTAIGTSGGKFEVTADGLTIESSSSNGVTMNQKFYDNIPNGVYTFSILTQSNELFYETLTWNGSSLVNTGWFTNSYGESFRLVFQILSSIPQFRIHSFANSSAHVAAVKLEEGTEQTLAYKDALGKWQLYETPDYDLELMKCQRWYLKTKLSRVLAAVVNSNGTCTLMIPVKLPVPMRKNIPTIKTFMINSWIYHKGKPYDTNIQISSVSVTVDGSCDKDGNIAFVANLTTPLQNYETGGLCVLASLDLELDAS